MGSCDYEAVSALVDGELGEQECEGVIRHLNECGECCRLFERFHATRNFVRGEGSLSAPQDFCERVSAAIANEVPPATDDAAADNVVALDGQSAKACRGRPTTWAWVASAAGLAGIALGAGLVLNQTPTPGQSGSSPSLAQSPPSQAETTASRPQSPDSDNVAAIKRYLPEHSSFVPSGSGAEFQRTRLQVDKR
jgi:negative regulator of sigma E activity